MANFRITGINHIGLAPKDPEKARWFLTQVLGLSHLADELVSEQKTMTMMFSSQSAAAADTPAERGRLEILSPAGENSPIARFLEKKGAGIHHLAVSVDHIDHALAALKQLGIRMIDETPRRGAHDTRIAFVHPEATGGLLIELVEEAKA